VSTAVFERGFLRSIATLEIEDQKRCFQAVYWFEHHCPSGDRQKRSSEIELSSRRRLRAANASKTLRVVYETIERNIRHWVWAGEEWDLGQIVAGLDDAKRDEEPETLDVKTLLSWLKDAVLEAAQADESGSVDADSNGHSDETPPTEEQVAESTTSQASGAEVDRLIEAADAVSLFVAESRSVWDRVKTKLDQTAEPMARAVESQAIVAVLERPEQPDSACRTEGDTTEPETRQGLIFQDLLANYNALRAENERLKESLKIERKRTNLEKLEAAKALQRMSSEETKIAKGQANRLMTELAAIKSRPSSVLTEEAKQAVKDACSRLIDEYANRLAATEIPSLEEQAREIFKLAVRVRAVRI